MYTQNEGPLTQAKYSEWLASLFGACFVAYALGVWLNELFDSIAWVVLIAGVALHSWGMYDTYQRNR